MVKKRVEIKKADLRDVFGSLKKTMTGQEMKDIAREGWKDPEQPDWYNPKTDRIQVTTEDVLNNFEEFIGEKTDKKFANKLRKNIEKNLKKS